MEVCKIKKAAEIVDIPKADLVWFLSKGWELVKEEVKVNKESKPKHK